MFISLTLDQILRIEGLPPRLITFFASQCAKDSMSKVKAKDPRSMLAVEVSERYGNGEDFSQEYLKKVCDDAYSAYHSVAYVSHATASTAYRTALAAALAYSSASAAFVVASAFASINEAYKPLLIEIIESRLTTIEKLLIFN